MSDEEPKGYIPQKIRDAIAEEEGDKVEVKIPYRKIKWIARKIVKLGTMSIVVRAIDNNTKTDEKQKRLDKVAEAAAGYAIGGIVADATAAWTDKFIDELADSWFKAKKAVKELEEELDSEES